MVNVQHSSLTGTNQHEPKDAQGASVDTVYVSDGGGSGTWKKNEADNVTVADAGGFFTGTEVEAVLQELGPSIAVINPTYGEMQISGNGTATTISSSGVYVQVVAGWITGLVDQVTFDTDHLVIVNDGVYALNCAVSFTGQTNETFKFEFHVDTGGGYNPINKGAISRKTSSTDIGALGMHALVSLNAGDLVALFVQNTGATGNPTITDGDFYMHRVKAE